MNDRERQLDALDRWLLEVREGTSTPEQTAHWNARLAADPVLRAALVRRMQVEACLVEELQSADAEAAFRPWSMLPPSDAPRPSPRGQWFPGRTWLYAAAACVAASLVLLVGRHATLPKAPAPAPPAAVAETDEGEAGDPVFDVAGVAILTKAVAVEWRGGARPLKVDDRVAPQRISIASGLLQLEFFSGSTVVLEGPADFEIISGMRCVCHSGKLRAEVPPQAIGFTIGGGGYDVVDLGTEFAMRVDERGAGEVHVLDGEVALRRRGRDEERRMKVGEAVQISPAGDLSKVAVDRASFVDSDSLVQLEKSNQAARYAAWREASLRWANDPDVLLYYDFEGQGSSRRRLLSPIPGASPSLDAAIVGCRWTQGRFGGVKGALEFKRTSDRVRVRIPGEFKSLSFVVWLRLGGLDQWYNSLLLTDEYRSGEVHWQLTNTGCLRVTSAGAMKGKHFAFTSEPVLGPQDLGRWVQLATVLDAEAKKVRHYRDGRLVREGKFVVDAPLRLGAAELGNWSPKRPPSQDAIRSLNGLVDEFAVFRRALTSAEIEASYQTGAPDR